MIFRSMRSKRRPLDRFGKSFGTLLTTGGVGFVLP